MNSSLTMAVPEGYERMAPFGPFHELLGPMYVKQESEGCFVVGLRVEDKHRNRGQMMHGGMICTLADTATAWASKHSRTPMLKVLTTNLSVNLMGNAAPGDWVEARAQILRSGRSVVFSNCHVSCNGKLIAQASAQFQVTGEVAAMN
jgi:uncharacterized protein (TIGR00369 family)